ncbi:DNA methyltransferase [Nonomuraea sp. NPDC049750]|uniref:DNA methyltransferase n=1 Tax=Nonomuraea sp. NPDC049750 TaxID=3154738 RepID=UPI0033C6BA16
MTTTMAFNSITNQGEYISSHYLAALMKNDLEGLRKRWRQAEKTGLNTGGTGPFSSAQGLKALGQRFFARRDRIVEQLGENPSWEELTDPQITGRVRELNDEVLRALGYTGLGDEEGTWLRRADLDVVFLDQHRQVPVALAVTGSGGLELVALDATWAAGPDGIADEAGPLLARPIKLDGKQIIDNAGKAIEFLFGCEEAPRYVLLLAGNVVLLADAKAWPKGFIAVDLSQALHARDDKPGGELETIAALFGAESLINHEGQAALADLVDKGHKHAVSVSKELREALRQSVELVAQEILDRVHEQGADHEDLGDDLARRLTEQSLRYLYRILFLLYAEARPELGILPSKHEAYKEGYGLARLGETVSYDLPEEAEQGLYFHNSLGLLFTLVDQGYRPSAATRSVLDEEENEIALGSENIRFEALKSTLFRPDRTPLIGEQVRVGPKIVDTRLRNKCLWQVLNLLMISPEQGRGRGRKQAQRGFISYAQLGINQLGAVYEGLMSYTGFFAPEDVHEVAQTVKSTGRGADGAEKEKPDPSKGTWIVPVTRSGDYAKYLVRRTDPITGEQKPIIHEKGSFVYRLSGRERQRSASYYTPEVLTACTVKHALAELLTETTTSRDILDITVCEPALGSGAFLNEAINQLADRYMELAQHERDVKLLPEQLEKETQKVKAFIALHNCYGVDLNATAVELAEVSVWLNVMHEGLQAPWFGLHLRRGNSLIGARRAVYHADQLKLGAWRTAPPTDRPLLCDGENRVIDQLDENEIHHFLLPAQGWGAVVNAPQATELAKEERTKLMAWRTQIRKSITDKATQKRLTALGQRVERLWELTRKRIAASETEIRRHIEVWGVDPTHPLPEPPAIPTSQEKIVNELYEDEKSPYNRLKTVMDAWCSLWFWPIGQGTDIEPPTLSEWIDFCEAVLGIEPERAKAVTTKEKKRGNPHFDDRYGLFEPGAGFEARAEDDANDRFIARCLPMSRVAIDERFAWWSVLTEIARNEGFFHWELEFAQVFGNGGFDLQVGNPPWRRPEWSEPLFLAEYEPRASLELSKSSPEFAHLRTSLLGNENICREFLADLGNNEAVRGFLNDKSLWPSLGGDQANLYLSFIELTYWHRRPSGIIGLIHQDGHVEGISTSTFRNTCYRRLRRHFGFVNQDYLFEDLGNTEEYSVNVYGDSRSIGFIHVSGIHLVETLEGSFSDAEGMEIPGVKLVNGDWDRRPHRSRRIVVDEQRLSNWARFQGIVQPGLFPGLLRPVSTFDAQVIEQFTRHAGRCGDLGLSASSGFTETSAKNRNYIQKRTHRPQSLAKAVFQSPFIGIATPFAKEPGPLGKNHRDYARIDLSVITPSFVPRTNFEVLNRAAARQSHGPEDRPDMWCSWRVLIREFVDVNMERTLTPALIPPHASHVHMCRSLAASTNENTVLLAGLLSSMPYDFALRISGSEHITKADIARLPLPADLRLALPLKLRLLRLSCLTKDYAELWEELFNPIWENDSWTQVNSSSAALGNIGPAWTPDTPLRIDFLRRQACLEIDVLVALMIGLEIDDLCAMYRTQFGLMRRYEKGMLFGEDGHAIAAEISPSGARQTADEGEIAKKWKAFQLDSMDEPVVPDEWVKPDRESEMTRAHVEFRRRLDAGEYPEVVEP